MSMTTNYGGLCSTFATRIINLACAGNAQGAGRRALLGYALELLVATVAKLRSEWHRASIGEVHRALHMHSSPNAPISIEPPSPVRPAFAHTSKADL